jgi:hypothetical protein
MRRGQSMLMRGGTLVIGMLLAATALAPAAHAASGRAVTGPVVGSAPFDFNSCSFVHQVYDGDISTRSGQVATLDVDVCVDIKGDTCTVKGTFVIEEGGGKVRGGASGSADCVTPKKRIPFDFTLHVRHAAPGLADVGQDLHFRGVWTSDQVSGGPFKGKVSLT